MSLLCTKQFTLAVTSSFPAPVAYYKCESAPDDGAITRIADSIGSRDLLGGNAGGFTSVIAGAVNNGLQLSNQNWLTNDWTVTTDDFWNFSGSDLTVRFWYRANSLPMPNGFYLIGMSFTQWYFQAYQSPDILELNVNFETGAPGSVQVNIPVTDTNWHRYVLIFKNGVGWSYKIDNNATVFSARTDPMEIPIAAGDKQLDLASGTNVHCMDEIGIWKVALTEAQLTYDWNSGAGRTYP